MATLHDLGLSEYEASVYRTLLSTGPTTAKTLSRASDVPMGRIYDVLSELESAEMIRVQHSSQPKKYAPVTPETALELQLDAKRAELETELDEYESIVEELTTNLNDPDPDEEFWTVAVGPDDSLDLLEERLGTANDQIIVVADGPSSEYDPKEIADRLTAEMETALERGVKVSMLIAPRLLEAIPNEARRGYRRSVREHPEFEIRIAEEISGSFTLIDRVEILIQVPNPLSPSEMFALIDLTDPSFAADAYDEFRPRWKQAQAAPMP